MTSSSDKCFRAWVMVLLVLLLLGLMLLVYGGLTWTPPFGGSPASFACVSGMRPYA